MYYVLCIMHSNYVLWFMYYALYTMHYVLCVMHYVLSTMCYVLCPVDIFHGLSPMYYVICTLKDLREMESIGIPTTAQGMGIISSNVLCTM